MRQGRKKDMEKRCVWRGGGEQGEKSIDKIKNEEFGKEGEGMEECIEKFECVNEKVKRKESWKEEIKRMGKK